jgi:nitroreductase/NAD-dependent dihydropyrimidine dehydrogenase PreA subunit
MGSLTIDKDKCISDGICVSECPSRSIYLNKQENYPSPEPDFEDTCIKCGHCVAVCPTQALSLDWLSPNDCTPIEQGLNIAPDQAEQFLCARRSIRSFQGKTVPASILEKVIEIACFAPSAKNVQPWHWLVVQNPKEVHRLAGMVIDWMRSIILENEEAAQAIGFTRVVQTWDEGYDRITRGAPHIILVHADKNWGFASQDCTLAFSHLDLYCTSIGLGACWAGYFYNAVNAYQPLFKDLGLPGDHAAYGAMMVGYPKFKYQCIPVRNKPLITWK